MVIPEIEIDQRLLTKMLEKGKNLGTFDRLERKCVEFIISQGKNLILPMVVQQDDNEMFSVGFHSPYTKAT